MSVEFTPLKSGSGFASPGFLVSATGDLTVDQNATVLGTLYAQRISFGSPGSPGFSILENDDSTVSLSSEIRNSSLSSLGVLDRLEVDGDVRFGLSSTNFLTIDDGRVVINSLLTGSLDNVDIGTVIPGRGVFVDLEVASADSSGNLRVAGNLEVTLAANIGTLTVDAATADDITINNSPTEVFHATRKDYVDNRISAFAIAFGA